MRSAPAARPAAAAGRSWLLEATSGLRCSRIYCQTGRKAEHQVIALEQGASRRTLHYFYKFASGLKTQMSLIWGLGLVHPHVQPGARRISLPASQNSWLWLFHCSSASMLAYSLPSAPVLSAEASQSPAVWKVRSRAAHLDGLQSYCAQVVHQERGPAFLLHKQLRNLAARGMKGEEIEMAR